MSRFSVVILGLLACAPTTARADIPIEAGAFGGAHLFNDNNRLGRPRDAAPDTALENTGAFGFRFGFVLIPRLALEAELLLAPTQTASGAASVLAIGWRGQAVVHLLTGRWRPFVLAGGGGFTSSSSDTDLARGGASQDTKGELHLGAGVKVDIGCRWGLRVDGRVQFGRATGHGVYFTEDGELLLGLYGLFGKGIEARCSPAPAPPRAPTPPPQPQ